MKRFGYSVLASNRRLGMNHHSGAMIEAASEDEALGMAYRIAAKLYPAADGWGIRSAVVFAEDHVMTYETVRHNPPLPRISE